MNPKENAVMTSLANKTALITGASRGMGRATALALAAAGARVIVHYGRNADEAKAVVDQIRAAGGRAASLWMIKRIEVDGWDQQKALDEAVALGLTNDRLKQFALNYVQTHKP